MDKLWVVSREEKGLFGRQMPLYWDFEKELWLVLNMRSGSQLTFERKLAEKVYDTGCGAKVKEYKLCPVTKI